MSDVVVITGSAGLIGSEAARFFGSIGMQVVGIDNDLRRYFFGDEASTAWNRNRLENEVPNYVHHDLDIRDREGLGRVFKTYGMNIALVIHAAAQPSHDWAARDPVSDFTVNANGTLALLEATRETCPNSPFIFTSTNKVYGDTPNALPLTECETRWEISPDHRYVDGISEDMSIDQSKHSLFGVSKAAADLLVQEYGRYFGMATVVFRGGCLTGPSHSGTQLHGFLSYLMKCTATGRPYSVFGYNGKQVRDNIHSADLIQAFYQYFKSPRAGEVYNMGGGRASNCSMKEAIAMCNEIASDELKCTYVEQNRSGDHIWYVSNLSKFRSHFPEWNITYDVRGILQEIYDLNKDRWSGDDQSR